MKAYELMLMNDPSLDEDARASLMEKVQGIITADGGTVESFDDWGKRKLAFEVDDLTEGAYSVIQFHATAEIVAELDRVLRITDPVLRFMIVRLEDID